MKNKLVQQWGTLMDTKRMCDLAYYLEGMLGDLVRQQQSPTLDIEKLNELIKRIKETSIKLHDLSVNVYNQVYKQQYGEEK